MPKIALVNLEKNEQILALVRASLWSKWRQIALMFFVVLLTSLLLFPFIQFGLVGTILVLTLVVLTVLYVLREWKKWYGSVFIVTDKRVIDVDQFGLRKSEHLSVRYQDIKDVQAVQKGALNKAMDIGKIRVKTKKHMSYDIAVNGIKRSSDVVALIHDVQYVKKGKQNNQVHAAKTRN